MEPDRTTPPTHAPLDDAALAAAVREVADDWRMPPQRFDDVTWRDRVGRRRGSGGGGRGVVWSRRLVGAAALAVVATVSLSYLAVWLTGPSRDHAATNPSTAPTASPGVGTPAPSPSSAIPDASANGELPRLALNGAMPDPSQVLVRTNGGAIMARLDIGSLGLGFETSLQGPFKILQRPGGGWVCVCWDWTRMSSGAPEGMRIRLGQMGASGRSSATRIGEEFVGTYDPNTARAMQPQLVDAHTSATPDGRFALIGWSRRDGANGWLVGVDVLDLATLETTSSSEVRLDVGISGNQARTRPAPVASVSPSGTTLLLTSDWYVEDPSDPTPTSGTDHWVTPLAEGRLGPDGAGGAKALASAGSQDAGGCPESERGLIDDSTYYSICWKDSTGQQVVSRVRLDGSVIDSTDLPLDDSSGSASFLARTNEALFSWNPFGASMVRYDLATGEVTQARATRPTSSAPSDVLASLGRRVGHWIAPSAYAKVNLDPAIVASADGTRIYALGIGGPDGGAGSTGVFAFDARTLDVLGTWAPLADLGSIAVSADGRFVYAAGQGGVGVDGQPTPGSGASITVYDTTDGSVRLVAGHLGTGDLWLVDQIVR